MHKKYPPQGTLLSSSRHSAEELATAPISTLPGIALLLGNRQPLLGIQILCTQPSRGHAGEYLLCTPPSRGHAGDTDPSLHSVGIPQSLTCWGYRSQLCFGNPHRYSRWGNEQSSTCWGNTIQTLLGERQLLRWGGPNQSTCRIPSAGDADIRLLRKLVQSTGRMNTVGEICH